jgi:hypothetical protein
MKNNFFGGGGGTGGLKVIVGSVLHFSFISTMQKISSCPHIFQHCGIILKFNSMNDIDIINSSNKA